VLLDRIDVIEKQLAGNLRVAQQAISKQVLQDIGEFRDLVVLLMQLFKADHDVIS
jgi:hypothetical protein